ncbi:hypothetical protein F4777DRAFT_181333 [Nemania sp. FL0916]|nr:hypothetical protein F4777DRAFT_181333 [Nemania sp. FL0916]
MVLSQPFTSPSPQASGQPTCAPIYSYDRPSNTDSGINLLTNSDPESSGLLPRRQRQHRVRIQGRLAIVRSVSVANLRQAKNSSATVQADINNEDAPGSAIDQRGSYDGSETEDEDDHTDVVDRDAQFRGYGIGGAGNIRRPTDVIGSSSSTSPSLLSLIRTPPSSPTLSFNATTPGKFKKRMAGLLHGLRGRETRSKDSYEK